MGQLLTQIQTAQLNSLKYHSSSNAITQEENLYELWLKRYLKKYNHEGRTFTDLRKLPPELGLKVLSNLDADDLKRVTEIWTELADDNSLWKRLCHLQWGYCTAYTTAISDRGPCFWKNLYRSLESATFFFNSPQRWNLPINPFTHHKLVDDSAQEWAEFLFYTDSLEPHPVEKLLRKRLDVLHHFMWKYDFTNVFLPVALRSFFFKLSISTTITSRFTTQVFQEFTSRYCHCNAEFHPDSLMVVVFALNILSNDLSNPNIKNKMSKREYIKNTMKAIAHMERPMLDTDYLCHTYDNVYLIGHIAPVRFASQRYPGEHNFPYR